MARNGNGPRFMVLSRLERPSRPTQTSFDLRCRVLVRGRSLATHFPGDQRGHKRLEPTDVHRPLPNKTCSGARAPWRQSGALRPLRAPSIRQTPALTTRRQQGISGPCEDTVRHFTMQPIHDGDVTKVLN